MTRDLYRTRPDRRYPARGPERCYSMTEGDDRCRLRGWAGLRRRRRLLLIQPGNEPGRGLWSVPGGRVEPGETTPKPWSGRWPRRPGWSSSPARWSARCARGPYVIADYRCTVVGGTLRAGDDATDARWCDAADAGGAAARPPAVRHAAGVGRPPPRQAGLLGHGPARLLAAARVAVGPLGHHHLAPERAHHRAVLLVAAGLHVDDAAVVLRARLGLVQHLGLAVDRVAVEGRAGVLERLHLEVGDRLARDVGHRHAQQQRVDVVADHHVALKSVVSSA